MSRRADRNQTRKNTKLLIPRPAQPVLEDRREENRRTGRRKRPLCGDGSAEQQWISRLNGPQKKPGDCHDSPSLDPKGCPAPGNVNRAQWDGPSPYGRKLQGSHPLDKTPRVRQTIDRSDESPRRPEHTGVSRKKPEPMPMARTEPKAAQPPIPPLNSSVLPAASPCKTTVWGEYEHNPVE